MRLDIRFFRGRKGDIIARSSSGKIVLVARNSHRKPQEGERWVCKVVKELDNCFIVQPKYKAVTVTILKFCSSCSKKLGEERLWFWEPELEKFIEQENAEVNGDSLTIRIPPDLCPGCHTRMQQEQEERERREKERCLIHGEGSSLCSFCQKELKQKGYITVDTFDPFPTNLRTFIREGKAVKVATYGRSAGDPNDANFVQWEEHEFLINLPSMDEPVRVRVHEQYVPILKDIILEVVGYRYNLEKRLVTLIGKDGREILLPKDKVPLERIDFIISEAKDNIGQGHESALVEIKEGQAHVIGYRDGCTGKLVYIRPPSEKQESSKTQKEPEKVSCPICNTLLPSDAERCPGCGEWLEDI